MDDAQPDRRLIAIDGKLACKEGPELAYAHPAEEFALYADNV